MSKTEIESVISILCRYEDDIDNKLTSNDDLELECKSVTGGKVNTSIGNLVRNTMNY